MGKIIWQCIINSVQVILGILGLSWLIDKVTSFVLYSIVAPITSSGIAYFIAAKLTFPGVIVHECSHALGAFITGARVIEFHPFYFFVKNGGTLGEVVVGYNTGLWGNVQKFVTGIGPLIGCSVVLYFLSKWNPDGYYKGIKIWLTISMIIHMNMSGQDIRVLAPSIPFMIIAMSIIMYATGLYKVNILEYIKR